MACDILTVFVSTVSSEASFSIGGRVITEIRCGLSPETVKALVRHEVVREEELVNAMEKLKLLRPDWIPASPPHSESEDNN
ncbi:putative ac9 transposase [Fagus crenata]